MKYDWIDIQSKFFDGVISPPILKDLKRIRMLNG